MAPIIDMEEARVHKTVKRAYRNWKSRFKEAFGLETRLSHISIETLSFLAQGKDKGTFYLYDFLLNLQGFGSGFEFNELDAKKKMTVIDQYLFLLDQIRFECMKRLGWLERYPGEEFAMVDLVLRFESLAPSLQAKVPILSKKHPRYEEYAALNTFDKEAFVRKLIPEILETVKP